MKFRLLLLITNCLSLIALSSCSYFTYKTYDERLEEVQDDPEPKYDITLNPDFQNYTNYMFIGNRVENFGTYFNTYFNAKENFDDAYEDYETRVLASYGERLDSVYITPPFSQEAKDKFNKAIEKASKVIQYHKSSSYMDEAVLLIGKAYFYLGDYLKAERKFSEFISKLPNSKHYEEAVLFLSRTQLRLNNQSALERTQNLIKTTSDNSIKALAYQTLAEHYINKKDYESAVANYKKSVEFSSDDEFKAQMQYLIASVVSIKDPGAAAKEYRKVLEFGTSFDLEYYARLNYVKNLILSGRFSEAAPPLEQLKIKYKDNPEFQSDIDLLKARYYLQKKEYKKALSALKAVISGYPKSVAAADAAYFIADYYEADLTNYLDAYRFYKFSIEQNSAGHYAYKVNSKIRTFKRYFELKSVVTGREVKTEYGSEINNLLKVNTERQEGEKQTSGEEKEKEKGQGQSLSSLNENFVETRFIASQIHFLTDSLVSVDSFKIKEQQISNAQFELAELFIYELDRPDSAEYYLIQAHEKSQDYDFKAKVLLALANLYRNQNLLEKTEETLRRIVEQFPLGSVANAARGLLNLPVVQEESADVGDSIYANAEEYFVSQQYNSALNGFVQITNNYSGSKHFGRCAYAAGWIYENILSKPDSAVVYYEKILAADPKSEFARMVEAKVSEYKKKDLPPEEKEIKEEIKEEKKEEIKEEIKEDIKEEIKEEKKEEIKQDEGDVKEGEDIDPIK